jgi:hypothetical protein
MCYGDAMAKKKNPHAAALGRKGGKARWAGASAEERSEHMKKAVQARWRKAKAKKPK